MNGDPASVRARLDVGYLTSTPAAEVDGDVRELAALGKEGSGDTRVRIVRREGCGATSARLKLYRKKKN
jgi:hypothetical protein